ncbi:alpha/beta hydrolase domain-containing protein, partial [Nocardia gipuzkoensis]
MGVEAVRFESVSPYEDRPYELVRATVDFSVDPEHPANRRIVDLELARRADDGLVRFEADLRMLR